MTELLLALVPRARRCLNS